MAEPVMETHQELNPLMIRLRELLSQKIQVAVTHQEVEWQFTYIEQTIPNSSLQKAKKR